MGDLENLWGDLEKNAKNACITQNKIFSHDTSAKRKYFSAIKMRKDSFYHARGKKKQQHIAKI
jgi:hypothetical protein